MNEFLFYLPEFTSAAALYTRMYTHTHVVMLRGWWRRQGEERVRKQDRAAGQREAGVEQEESTEGRSGVRMDCPTVEACKNKTEGLPWWSRG